MNILDSIIGYISPRWGADRIAARATMKQINAMTGGEIGYAAGKSNRLNRPSGSTAARAKESVIPAGHIEGMTVDAWALYRDNPYARKIVSSLQSKVIGKGMSPESHATKADGSPHTEFRARAKQLWDGIQHGFDLRGLPGKGGQTFPGLQRLAFKAVILSGDTLFRLKDIDESEMIRRDLPVSIALQILDSSRLAKDNEVDETLADGHQLYRGIELDEHGVRVAYWISTYRPGDSEPTGPAKRYSANEIGHLFLEEDIDQYRGTTWLASTMPGLRNSGDLEFNVLTSSKAAACVVGSYSLPTGAKRFGLGASSEAQSGTADGTELTDIDGNEVTRLQPAMLLNVGQNGKFELHSPNQPNMNPEGFIQHMLRGVSAGTPGIKSSTVTGDYRNSSFSSEKSADNDIWPEVEALQDWFASNFCQRIYEAVIRDAVFNGYFGGIVSSDEYLASPGRFHACAWQGPVSRSINPTDDAEAAGTRMQKGISSLQLECAKVNVSWRDVLGHAAELYTTAKAMGLPPEVVNNILGIGANDVIAQTNKASSPAADKSEPRSLSEEHETERLADAISQ